MLEILFGKIDCVIWARFRLRADFKIVKSLLQAADAQLPSPGIYSVKLGGEKLKVLITQIELFSTTRARLARNLQ